MTRRPRGGGHVASAAFDPAARRSSSRYRAAAALVSCVLITAASASCTSAAPSPPTTSTTGSTSAAPAGPPTLVAVPDTLPVSAARGLVPVTDSTNDTDDARFVSTFAVPAVPAYSDTAQGEVSAATADYEEQRRAAAAGGPLPGGELKVTSDVSAAAGQVVGITVDAFVAIAQGVGGGDSSSTTTYAVLPGGFTKAAGVVTSPQLLTDDGQRDLARAVYEVIASSQDAYDNLPAAPTAAVTDDLTQDLRVQPDGSLIAVIGNNAGLTFPVAGPKAVRVPAATAAPWLSDAGRTVLTELTSGKPFAGVSTPAGATAATETTTSSPPSATASSAPAVDCRQVKCIALTFDDGPGPYTSELLSILATADVRATFMVVGRNVAAQPDTVRQELAAGHEIGNHTWDHPDLTKLDTAAVDAELDKTADAVAAATGGHRPTVVRPPYGAINAAVRDDLAQRGQAAVLWDVDTEDWKNRNAQTTAQRALDGAQPGAIVLMHDIHPTTVQAVPQVIEALRAQGYTFVTVSQLLGEQLTPGKAYGRGPHPGS